MSDKAPTIIQQKKDGKNSDEKQDPRWGAFVGDLTMSLVVTLVYGIVSANFVFLVAQNLGKLLPSNENFLPYKNVKSPIGQTRGAPACMSKTLDLKFNEERQKKLEYITGFGTFGFPYNLSNNDDSLVGSFKNWFSDTIKYAYVKDRGLLGSTFEKIGGFCNEKIFNETVLFLIGFPIIASLLFIGPLVGGIMTFVGSLVTNWKWGIPGLFFGISGLIAFFVGIMQGVQLTGTTLFIPPFAAWGSIQKIMKHHKNVLGVLFALLVINSAFKDLGGIWAIGTLITFIIISIRHYVGI